MGWFPYLIVKTSGMVGTPPPSLLIHCYSSYSSTLSIGICDGSELKLVLDTPQPDGKTHTMPPPPLAPQLTHNYYLFGVSFFFRKS